MFATLLGLFRFVRLLGGVHQAVVIENLLLRHQLAAYRRKGKCLHLTRFDRWFWVSISYLWKDWRSALTLFALGVGTEASELPAFQEAVANLPWAGGSFQAGCHYERTIAYLIQSAVRADQ